MEHRSKIAAVICDSYNREKVDHAISEVFRILGGVDIIDIPKSAEVLLKPNLLAKAEPEKAVTTHPEVFRAVAKVLQNAGYTNIVYGDSPGNPLISVEKTAEGAGIKAVADELGIRLGDFEHGREIEAAECRTASKFVLCEEVARILYDDNPQGGIINLCKMKTHQLERITGAMKNTFGCVYGVNKSASHAKYPNAEVFGRMTADLNRIVWPKLHIMDGIVAMEGNGPMSGDPIKMNIILASTDPVAIDTAFCNLVNLNQDYVPTNVAGEEAGIGTSDETLIDVVVSGLPMVKDDTLMTLDELAALIGNKNFRVQRNAEYRGQFRGMKTLFRFLQRKPVVKRDLCVGCGICVEACPVEDKAIMLENGLATYDYTKCIKCYCCQEMCPKKAIDVKVPLLAKLVDREWKI